MPTRIVNQETVLSEARSLLRTARGEIRITSPWIRQKSANTLLREVLSRVESGELTVQVVWRLKEPTDLEITELEGLKALEEAGCEVRFSNRLHAKVVIVDDRVGIVGSSNLTATAGYGELPADWRNEELGVVIEDDPDTLRDLRGEFDAIWEAASALDESTMGVAMDFPTVDEFNFVAIRSLKRGEFAMAQDLNGNTVLGRIAQITAYNRSFPRMSDSMWVTQGYAPVAGNGFRQSLGDLQSLFSHPSKEHGYLVAKTFHEPASAFQIARVEVLKSVVDDQLRAAAVPVAPGSDVRRADSELLRRLIGEGDLPVGVAQYHEEVPVHLASSELLSKHLAVLGMTGSGKSNSLKVIIQRLLNDGLHPDLRVVVIDTHGEYVPIADELSTSPRIVDVELRRSILDEEVVMDLMRVTRKDSSFHQDLIWEAHDLGPMTSLDEFLAALEASGDDKKARLVAGARGATDLCLWPEDEATIVSAGMAESFDAPGLYVLDLRTSSNLEERGAKAASVMRYLFQRAKEEDGGFPTAVVVDEAQNYAPEQQTGWLSRARDSFSALFEIASEGRKFGIGLIVSTQRPARVNKDVLSQCNTHMIFRVANLEDLQAIGGSFEAASQPLLQELPGFDTGVCVVGGTALNMVTRVEIPLFGGDQLP